MEFGIGKRAMFIMKSRKQQMTEGIELPNQEKIRMPREKEIYKHSGILEMDTIKQEDMKEKRKKYLKRPRNYSKLNYIAISSKG